MSAGGETVASPTVGNWGRWGAQDERGALNLITPERVREAAQGVRTGKVYPLGLPIQRSGIPLADYRGTPQRLTLTNHDDEYLAQAYGGAPGTGFNEDVFVFAAHTSTHMDALGHVYAHGRLYNGFAGDAVSPYSGAPHCGIDKVGAVAGRGVLIDVAAAKGVALLEPGYVITPEDLTTALDRQGLDLRPGDLVLIRTGWIEAFLRDPALDTSTMAGIGLAAARYLAAQDVAVVGADNVAVEAMPFDEGTFLGVHVVLLVEHGIHLVENLHLGELAADGCHEFLLALAPLRVTGATGSPLTPFAIG
jgi:kynurenine formamidase